MPNSRADPEWIVGAGILLVEPRAMGLQRGSSYYTSEPGRSGDMVDCTFEMQQSARLQTL